MDAIAYQAIASSMEAPPSAGSRTSEAGRLRVDRPLVVLFGIGRESFEQQVELRRREAFEGLDVRTLDDVGWSCSKHLLVAVDGSCVGDRHSSRHRSLLQLDLPAEDSVHQSHDLSSFSD